MVSALAGCVSPPPQGTFVEYRADRAPDTRKVTCEATYELVAQDPAKPEPIVRHHAVRGERLGFRREADGSATAVAPGYTFPLPPGAYSWEVVQSSVPSARERFWCEAREHSLRAAKVTGIVALVGAAIVLVLCVVFIILITSSNSKFPNYT